jgi:hypothetical protein
MAALRGGICQIAIRVAFAVLTGRPMFSARPHYLT